jgi:predicted lactoylglutathione lyase
MMDLETQIQLLINNAPQDGQTPQIVAAIAPTLLALAQKLQHTRYYILQNSQGNWVLTTLSNRSNPEIEKRVIYAFPTLQDVSLSSSAGLDPQILAKAMPVIQILFQLVALEPVDSIVFRETPGSNNHTVEVQRQEFQTLIQQQLQQQKRSRQVPPNIA